MLENYTIGGQSVDHSVRMFTQVTKKVILFGFIMFFGILATFVYIKTPTKHWYISTKIIEAKAIREQVWPIMRLINENPERDDLLVFHDFDGQIRKVHFSNFLAHRGVKAVEYWMLRHINQGMILGGILTFIFSIFLVIFLVSYSKKEFSREHRRGSTKLPAKQLNKKIVKQNRQDKKEYKKDYGKTWCLPDVQIANVTLPLEGPNQGIMLIGAPGTGKTICTHEILKQARAAGQRAIVYDIEGSFIPSYYRPDKDHLLSPLDERGARWNLWADCSSPSHFEDVAAKIIPDKNGAVDDFWLKAGRVMFSISASQFAKSNQQLTMPAFLKHLFASSKEQVEKLLAGTMGQAMVGKDLEKGTKSILLTLVTYCSSLLYLKDDPRDKPFSIRDWVADENSDSWLFISSKEEYRAALAPIMTMWLDIALTAFLSLPENYDRRFWLYFDELASLNKQTGLGSFLERSRKRGGCFVGTIHDQNQLAHLYGKTTSEFQKQLIGTTLYFGANNDESARRASNHLGQEEFVETRKSRTMGAHEMRDGVSVSNQIQKDFVVMPSEIMNLKKREAYLRISGGWPITKIKFQQQPQPKIEPDFVERDQSAIQHVLKTVEETKEQEQNLKEAIYEAEKEEKKLLEACGNAKGGST